MSIRYSRFQNLGAFRRRTYNSSNVLISQVFPALTVVGGGNQLVPQFYTPIKLNAVNPVRLIIGGDNSVYESLNRGDTITEIGRALRLMMRSAWKRLHTAVDGKASIIPMFCMLVQAPSFCSDRRSLPPLWWPSATYPGGFVRDIALDPEDWMTAYVIDSNRVFLTGNGGASWTEVTGNLSDGDLRGDRFRTSCYKQLSS